MLIFKILGFLFLVPGIVIVFGAREAVKRFSVGKNTKVEFQNEMSEAELVQYKENAAVIKVKMLGMLIALPGFVLLLIAFK